MTQEINGIPAADWEVTPASVKALVEELLGRFEHLNQQFKTLNQEMSPLSGQMHQLEQRLLGSSAQRSDQRLVQGFGKRTKRSKKRGRN